MAAVWPPPPDHQAPEHPLPDNRQPTHPITNHPLQNHPIPDNSLPNHHLHNHPSQEPSLADHPLPNHPALDNRPPNHPLLDNHPPNHPIPEDSLSNYPQRNHPLLNHSLPNHPLMEDRVPNHMISNNPLQNHPLPNYPLPDHLLPAHPIQHNPLANQTIPDNSLLNHPVPQHSTPDHQQSEKPLANQALYHPLPNQLIPTDPQAQKTQPDRPARNDPDFGPLDCSIPQLTGSNDNQPNPAQIDEAPPDDAKVNAEESPNDSAPITQHNTDNEIYAVQKEEDQGSQPVAAAVGSEGEGLQQNIKEEVEPPVFNCFVCDTSSTKTTTFLNVFKSDTAIREQLKERFEGVLAVTLEEEQSAGPNVCNGCSQTLENIECLAAGLRAAFTTTQHAHCFRRNGYDKDIKYSDDSKTPVKHEVGSTQRIKLRVRHYDPSERGKYREATSQTDGEGDDSDTEIGETSGAPAPKQSTPRKRKNAQPQRVIREDNGISSDDADIVDNYNAETDDQKDEDFNPEGEGYDKPIVVVRKKRPLRQRASRVIDSDDPDDNNFNPKESYQPILKIRKRGRPKGSKTKIKKLGTVSPKKSPVTPRVKDTGGVCETCQKVFSSNYKLNRHRLSHSQERPFKCPQCTHTFKAKYHLDRHLQIHSGVKPHLCPDCGSGFREKHQLAEHQLIHTGEQPHACTQCDQRFQKASALKVHMYDHTGAWPFKCAVCNVGFVREAELKDHVTIHTGEKPFKCPQCESTFRLASTLKVHMRRHSGVKPYVCQLCGGRYAAANTLKEHLRTHAGERNFLCQTCGAAFVHQSGLVQHAKTHLAIEDRKHVCPYCQRRFNELALLKRHQRIHTNERPYMCSKCGKAFRRPGELSMHYRYHSNDRRYVCITCNKSFFTRSHLKRHQATHNSNYMASAGQAGSSQPLQKPSSLSLQPTGQQSPRRYSHEGDYSPPEGVHICMICSKQFRSIEQLTKHISRIHNPNMPMDEHMTSVAAIEDYSHAYSEELGLPYMNPMHMMPPMPQ